MSMKCPAILAVLCAYFLVARVSQPSRSHFCNTNEPPWNIRFAPEVTVVGLQELVCSNWKTGHSLLHPTGRPPSLLSSILLLIAGDIEVNPGPAKHPCGSCSKAVKSNQCGIFCEVCYFSGTTLNVSICAFLSIRDYLSVTRAGAAIIVIRRLCPSMTAPPLLLSQIRL